MAAVYLPGIGSPFVYDDHDTVGENPSIRRLWPVTAMLQPPAGLPTTGRPLVNVTFALNYALDGANPRGYHAVNLVLHLVVAVLLFEVLAWTLREGRLARFAPVAELLAAGAALLWAVHPLNSEAVTYVTQRTELMVSLFFLATLRAAQQRWSTGRSRWTVAAVVCCALGMLCKETMYAAPLAVLAYQHTFVREPVRRSWRLYAGLALTWGVLAAVAIGARSGAAGFDKGVVPAAWWMTQAKVLFMYLKLAVWPHPLLLHYSLPYVDTFTAGLPWIVGVAALVAATAAGLWKRHPAGFVGAWCFLILAPTMIVPVVTEVAAERRMYLPLAALVALVVVGAYALVRRVRPVLAVAAVLAIGLGVVTAFRTAAYRDPIGLWEQVIAQGGDAVTFNNLGAIYADEGKHQQAMEQYQRALSIRSDYALVYSNLGASLAQIGRDDEAIEQYRKALAIRPDLPDAHYNLGVRLLHKGQIAEAVEHLETALRLNPGLVDAHVNLGVALTASGRYDEAVSHLRRALELEPNHPEACNNLGVALTRLDRWGEAIEAYRAAVKLDGNYMQAWVNLAAACAHEDRMDDAVAAARQALRLAELVGDTALAERLKRLIGE